MVHHLATARTGTFAFLATFAAAVAAPLLAHAQTAPTNLVARETILLHATTPLGEAGVEITPGTVLTNFEIQGDRVKLWRGPFTAVVDLAGVQPALPEATPSATPELSPDTSPAPTSTATAAPEQIMTPAPGPAPEATPLSWTNLLAGLEPPWVLPAIAGALALYALFTTVALLRARPPAARELPEPETPVITIPRSGTAKPAVISDGGRAIACPLCGANIAREKVHPGRNNCPSCRGRFVCE